MGWEVVALEGDGVNGLAGVELVIEVVGVEAEDVDLGGAMNATEMDRFKRI